jgi:hypothetical protein
VVWGMGCIGLAEVAGTCECGNEPSGSIKCGGIAGLSAHRLASQEGLCSVE